VTRRVSETWNVTKSDHDAFCEWSGDFSPRHSDVSFASSRYPYQIVAHGMHIALHLLNVWFRHYPGKRIRGFSASFDSPVFIGDTVKFSVHENRISALVENFRVATIEIDRTDYELSAFETPQIVVDDSYLRAKQSTGPFNEWARRKFNFLHRVMSENQVRDLGAMTAIVGMRMPGPEGILNRFRVKWSDETCNRYVYSASRRIPRFGAVETFIEAGTVKARVVSQIDTPNRERLNETSFPTIVEGEFAGLRPLITGVSGVLGSTAATLVALGGGTPLGLTSKSRVGGQIQGFNNSESGTRFHILTSLNELQDLSIEQRPNQLWHFASPIIRRRYLGQFRLDLFSEFLDVYVSQMVAALAAITQRDGSNVSGLLIPSSVELNIDRQEFREYVLAKKSAEAIGEQLSTIFPNLLVLAPRLEGVISPQASALRVRNAANPALVLLPIIRKLVLGAMNRITE
jgi:acyl dehydratase